MLENGVAERPVFSSQEPFGDAGSLTLPRTLRRSRRMENRESGLKLNEEGWRLALKPTSR